ncbi:hypothetical protein DFJ77DRAFT_479623 [Powellomyces hirtus]|nr:hypothetical protein DFJ77DRAFT_479623 [Powellomyces hirtus]
MRSSPQKSCATPRLPAKQRSAHPRNLQRTHHHDHASPERPLRISDLVEPHGVDDEEEDREEEEEKDVLAGIIRGYAALDLTRDKDAVRTWAQRKAAVAAREQQQQSHAAYSDKHNEAGRRNSSPLYHLPDTTSGSAFDAWKARKQHERTALATRTRLVGAHQDSLAAAAAAAHKAAAQRTRTQLELCRWRRRKDVDAELQRRRGRHVAEERDKRARERRGEARTAFEQWVQRKTIEEDACALQREREEGGWYPHPQAWVDVGPVDDTSATRVGDRVGLSPPHIYNDYALCAQLAPGFLKRYRVLVASAGVERADQSRSTVARASVADYETPPVLAKRGGPWVPAGGVGQAGQQSTAARLGQRRGCEIKT